MSSLYRTYRPQVFAEVTAQEHVKRTLQNQLKTGKIVHAYLFTGPRGVGKTTVARLLARAVNCEKWPPKLEGKGKPFEPCNKCFMCKEIMSGAALDVFEIDAASHTGVDNVRELIDGVRFSPNKGRFKVYIIDEVHMLSTAAFNALLKTLEEPPAHALFILATTEIHKVPATVVSRCQRFDFRRFTPDETVERLQNIIKAEKVKVDEVVLYEIARYSEGCERDAESLLGQLLALGEKEIGLEEAALLLPVAYTEVVLSFVEKMATNETAAAIRILNEGVEQGLDVPIFIENTVALLRTLLFIKLGGLERFEEVYEKNILERIKAVVVNWDLPTLTKIIEDFLSARRLAKSDAIPQLAVELVVLKNVFPFSVSSTTKKENYNTPTSSEISENKFDNKKKLERPLIKEETLEKSENNLISSLPRRIISLEETKQKWNELCQQIQDKNPSLVLILKNGEITSVENGRIEVKFAYALHAEMVSRAKNKKNIDDILSILLQTPISVSATHVSCGAVADETAAFLSEAFGGQTI